MLVDICVIIMLIQLIVYHLEFFALIRKFCYELADDTKYFMIKFLSLFFLKILSCVTCLSFWTSLIYFLDIKLALTITLLSHILDLIIQKLKN